LGLAVSSGGSLWHAGDTSLRFGAYFNGISMAKYLKLSANGFFLSKFVARLFTVIRYQS